MCLIYLQTVKTQTDDNRHLFKNHNSPKWRRKIKVKNCSNFASPSAPMETSLTPLLAIKSSALLTLAILWNRILPRSGLGRVSPEITSKSSISFSPLRKSSSMFSIAVPALRKCELHQAVKVCKDTKLL